MRIEVSGIGGEHFEPLPRHIHELFVPQLEVPELVEAYPGQLQAMYAASGREQSRPVVATGSLAASVCIDVVTALQQGALFGPHISAEGVIMRGGAFSVWRERPWRRHRSVAHPLFPVE